jgi:GNAT superfamily N-acetyltransferase
VEIVALAPQGVRPLRQAVLRPHERAEDLVWPGDEASAALHAGARDDSGAIVGVATVVPEPYPRDPRSGDWRLWGMATAPDARGRGVGRALLATCLANARGHGARRVWCTARTGALRFYERAGFAVESDVFDVPGIGPHVYMTLAL